VLETVFLTVSICVTESGFSSVKAKILIGGQKKTMFGDVSVLRTQDPAAVSLHTSLCSILSTRLAFVNSYKLLVCDGHPISCCPFFVTDVCGQASSKQQGTNSISQLK
jgi:hypothetical protein